MSFLPTLQTRSQVHHLLCITWILSVLNSLTAANTQALLGRDQTAVGLHKGPPSRTRREISHLSLALAMQCSLLML